MIYGISLGKSTTMGGLGFRGSPISTVISSILQLSILVVYMFAYRRVQNSNAEGDDIRGSVDGYIWSWERLRRYLRLGVPLAIGGQLEEAQIQIVSFLAGTISQTAIATHNGLLNILLFLTALQWGLMNATTIRTGHHLGRGSIKKCKSILLISSTVGMCIGVSISLIFILARSVIGRLYSDDPDVIAMTEPLCWLAGAGYTALTIFYVSMAILQAQGRTMAVALSFLIGAWIFGVPLAYVIGKVVVWKGVGGGLGLQGLWYGLSVGYAVTSLIAMRFVWVSDWEMLAIDAKERCEVESDEANVA